MKNKKVIFLYLITLVNLAIVSFYFREYLVEIFSNPEQVRNFVSGYGALGPIVIILLQALQAVIFFLPGPVFTIASGYLFGTFLGSIYSIIGVMLGSYLLFMIGRFLGTPIVHKFVKKEDLVEFEVFFKERGELALLISRLSPMFIPHDIISLVVSQAPIKTRRFLTITLLGMIPQTFLYAILGQKIASGTSFVLVAILSVAIIAILIYHLKRPIKVSSIDKLIRKTEEAEKEIETETVSLSTKSVDYK